MGLAEVSWTPGTVWAEMPHLNPNPRVCEQLLDLEFFGEHSCFSGFLYTIYSRASVTPLPPSVHCWANGKLAPNPARSPFKSPDVFDFHTLSLRTQHNILSIEITSSVFKEKLGLCQSLLHKFVCLFSHLSPLRLTVRGSGLPAGMTILWVGPVHRPGVQVHAHVFQIIEWLRLRKQRIR